MITEFGSDPMDKYSIPLETRDTRFGKIFLMPERRKPEKPGRGVMVTWDQRSSLVPEFVEAYSYIVRFDTAGNRAGNHYHELKQELFYPLVGVLKVVLEDTGSKEREEMELDASRREVLFIPAKIGHVVTAETDGAILLVSATSPNTENDEFPYKIV